MNFAWLLLGRWGSGKTRLARLVMSYMTKPNYFISEFGSVMACRTLITGTSMRYSIVWFSAWQYRRVPEAWIYLYETFSKALVSPDYTLTLCYA